MQIARLFEMVSLLLARDGMTARELAQRFEVSTRTIYRDVDILSGAGIPVYAAKGKNGGIRLLPEYVLNRQLLTEKERGEILAALHSLSAARMPEVEGVLDKLGALFRQSTPNWVEVDFSDWNGLSYRQLNLIKNAILSQKTITFDYYNQHNERTTRMAEPVQLWFKHRSWYLKAYCLLKDAPRVFKLGRMRDVRLMAQDATHHMRPEDTDQGSDPPQHQPELITMRMDQEVAYRVYDEFHESCVREDPDGSFQVTMRYFEDEWLYSYLLSFGPHVEVLSPPLIREGLKDRLKKMSARYDNMTG